ncbi:MAG: IPTL-CTERM sorting domain-containing protein [Thermodesulfobacteriota bacterium]
MTITPPPSSSAIPTLSEWGLIAMASILGIVGFMFIRRKKVTVCMIPNEGLKD